MLLSNPLCIYISATVVGLCNSFVGYAQSYMSDIYLKASIKVITLFVKHYYLSINGTLTRNIYFIKKWPLHQEMATSSRNSHILIKN